MIFSTLSFCKNASLSFVLTPSTSISSPVLTGLYLSLEKSVSLAFAKSSLIFLLLLMISFAAFTSSSVAPNAFNAALVASDTD